MSGRLLTSVYSSELLISSLVKFELCRLRLRACTLSRSNSGDRLLFLRSLSDGLRRRTPSLLSMLVLFLDLSRLSRSDFLRSALDMDFFGFRDGVSIGEFLVGRL